MTRAAARARLARIDGAGVGHVRFARAGSADPGTRHRHRIHDPTPPGAHDDSQHDANHVHTMRRDPENGSGRDRLRAHDARHRRDR